MRDGSNIGTLAVSELGLYNTPHLKNVKNKILKPFQTLPGSIGESFVPSYQRKKEAKSAYSKDQIASILEAFN